METENGAVKDPVLQTLGDHGGGRMFFPVLSHDIPENPFHMIMTDTAVGHRGRNSPWRTEIDRSLSGQFPVKPGAGFKVPSDKGGAGKQGIFMAHGMTADGMAVGDHLTDQLRMVPGMISDDKKGGGNIFVFQQVKQDGGITDIRPVVKS